MTTTPELDLSRPQPTAREKSPFYRPELDGLRFFAFLAVFCRHMTDHTLDYYTAHQVPEWMGRIILGISDAGSHGVDLFFVLSAYLITELLLLEKEKQGFLDVKAFYVRRILRIWPLYYVFIIVLEIASQLRTPHPFPLGYFLCFALLAGNWGVIAYHFPAWLAGPLWSVSIEEQFYLLWPPIVAKLTRRRVVVAAVLMIAAANATRIAMLMMHCTSWQIYFNTFVRLDEIACGILLAALLHRSVPKLSGAARCLLIAAAVVFIIVAGWYKAGHPNYPTWGEMLGSYPAAAVCCTLIVYCVLGIRFQSRSLRYLGKISYGLYVFHMACIMYVGKYVNVWSGLANDLLQAVIALVVTIAVAALSYRFLESPFLQLKRRFTHVDSRPV